jgi:hypothetical protein
LKKAVNLEPIGAASVAGATFGHSNLEAFSEAARFAGCPVFLVDHALAAVFALGDAGQVVVRTSEKGLKAEN